MTPRYMYSTQRLGSAYAAFNNCSLEQLCHRVSRLLHSTQNVVIPRDTLETSVTGRSRECLEVS